MKKIILVAGFISLTQFAIHAKLDPRPEAIPNKKISAFMRFWRGIDDFIFEESLGISALKPENERFIQNIIKELDMQDFCIELRSMSNYTQQGFSLTDIFTPPLGDFIPSGRANIFSIPAGLTRRSLTKVYISEEWFSSLKNTEKEALIKQELMHIKFGHSFKKSLAFIVALLGSLFIVSKWRGSSNNTVDNSFKSFMDDMNNFLSSLQLSVFSALFFTALYSRTLQKDADVAAAKTMKNTDGFISLLKNMQEHTEDYDSKFSLKRLIHRIVNPIRALFRFTPTFDTRIGYISELK